MKRMMNQLFFSLIYIYIYPIQLSNSLIYLYFLCIFQGSKQHKKNLYNKTYTYFIIPVELNLDFF